MRHAPWVPRPTSLVPRRLREVVAADGRPWSDVLWCFASAGDRRVSRAALRATQASPLRGALPDDADRAGSRGSPVREVLNGRGVGSAAAALADRRRFWTRRSFRLRLTRPEVGRRSHALSMMIFPMTPTMATTSRILSAFFM